MEPETLAAKLIDAAYRAPFDPSAWQDVVAPIAALSDSHKCGLHAVDAVRQRVLHVGVGNIDAGAIASYTSHFWTTNSYNPILARAGYDEVCQPTDRELDEIVLPSEFHHDWLKPNGLGVAGTAIAVRGSRGGRMDLRVNYPRKDREALDALYGRAFAVAAPHLARALDLAIHSATTAYRAGAEAAVSRNPVPTLLFSARGTVLTANPAAEALLGDGPLFVDRAGRLRAKVTRDNDAVAAALAAVLPPEGRASLLRVRDFGEMGDILVSVVPLAPATEEAQRWFALLDDNAPVALAYLSADAVGGGALETALADVYGLDRTEVLLAVALARGQRLSNFAAVHGLGTYRASLVLDRLMDRLGAHRPTDVVRKVATLGTLIAAPRNPPGF
jgi:PAS domain-containing protein